MDYDKPRVNANRQELRMREGPAQESRYGSTSPPNPSPDTSNNAVLSQGPDSRYQNIMPKRLLTLMRQIMTWMRKIYKRGANASRTKVNMKNGWRDRFCIDQAQRIPTEDTKSISRGSMSAHLCIANFKRSNKNVTPQGRHVLSSAHRYPRYAPSRMAVGGVKLKGWERGGKASHSQFRQRQISSFAYDSA